MYSSTRMSSVRLLAFFLCALLFNPDTTWSQLDFESEPIDYDSSPASAPVEMLRQRLASGSTTLKHARKNGCLNAVLEQLEIPVSSQMLVFSKTSFQLRRITSQRLRAVYFNNDVDVGRMKFYPGKTRAISFHTSLSQIGRRS